MVENSKAPIESQTGARPKAQTASILIRFAASVYDIALLFGVEFLAFMPIAAAEHYLGGMPDWIKGLLALTVAYAYFVGLWSKDGATTGMRPWHLRVAMIDSGDKPILAMAAVRFFMLMITWGALTYTLLKIAQGDTQSITFAAVSLLPAASLLCMILTPRHQALHDIISNTAVFRIAKPK
ncbi:MAG: RDD family protein [Mariprofundaceae bacterium]